MSTDRITADDIAEALADALSDPPFWADDFDMDLRKIFPEARGIMGRLAGVELVTTGAPDKNGRLNHPDVWNGDHAMLAWFGFKSPRRPSGFYSSRGPVRCTAFEAFRDAWSHQYLIIVEERPVWDSGPLWKHFETIMWDLRKWGGRPRDVSAARRAALRSYCAGVLAFGAIVDKFPGVRP